MDQSRRGDLRLQPAAIGSGGLLRPEISTRRRIPMSTYRLDKLLAPRSIAVVGTSPRPGSLGLTFLRNLIAGGFEGDIVFVNPHHVEIEGRACFPSLAELPEVPDLIVVAVPPEKVLGVIEDAGQIGVSVAIRSEEHTSELQ